ncbi:hypothetical protein FRC17_006997, partial [Serendipita sp. 399]
MDSPTMKLVYRRSHRINSDQSHSVLILKGDWPTSEISAFFNLSHLDITLKSSSEPGHFLEGVVHLILELSQDNQVVDQVNLLSRKSSPGTWDADQILILHEIKKEFMLSIFLEFSTEE